MRQYTNNQIVQMFEDEGIETTQNLQEAIYILDDGRMISGMFECGNRGEDHRIIEVLFEDIDRYSDNFWNQALERTGMIMHIPETSFILKANGIDITTEQEEYFNQVENVENI